MTGESSAMVLVLGTIRLLPERLAEVRAAMTPMITASLAEAGCLD